MIGIFRQKTPANILLLFIFGLLIKLPIFLHPHVSAIQAKDGIIFQWILKFLLSNHVSSFFYPCLSFILLYTQAISLNNLFNNQRMINRTSYLPGMSYLLITSFFAEWNYFSAPLLINTILIFVLRLLFKIYNQSSAKAIVYNIGLAIGVSGFVFSPSLFFMIWVFFSLMVMRPFRINEWLLFLLGIVTPFYFYGAYLFLTDQWKTEKIIPHFSLNMPSLQQSMWLAGSSLLLVIPFLTGGYFVQDNLRRMLIQVRKNWSLMLFYLLVAIFVPFLNTGNTFENWVMATVPFAGFHACTYSFPQKKIFPHIIFWLSVGFVLAYQYYGPGWT